MQKPATPLRDKLRGLQSNVQSLAGPKQLPLLSWEGMRTLGASVLAFCHSCAARLYWLLGIAVLLVCVGYLALLCCLLS